MEKTEKISLGEIVEKIEKILVLEEKLSAREILQILREIENNATIGLVLTQLQQGAIEATQEEIKNEINQQGPKKV